MYVKSFLVDTYYFFAVTMRASNKVYLLIEEDKDL